MNHERDAKRYTSLSGLADLLEPDPNETKTEVIRDKNGVTVLAVYKPDRDAKKEFAELIVNFNKALARVDTSLESLPEDVDYQTLRVIVDRIQAASRELTEATTRSVYDVRSLRRVRVPENYQRNPDRLKK